MAIEEKIMGLILSDILIQGESLIDVCKKYDLNIHTVRYNIKNHYKDLLPNGKIPHYLQESTRRKISNTLSKIKDDQLDELVQKYESGISIYILAKEYDCSHMAVHRALRRAGVSKKGDAIKEGLRQRALNGEFGYYADKQMNDLQACFKDWCDTEMIRYEVFYEIDSGLGFDHNYDFYLPDIQSMIYLNNKERDRENSIQKAYSLGYKVFTYTREQVIRSRGDCFRELFVYFQ